MTVHAPSRLRYIARSVFGGFIDYEVDLTNSVSTTDRMDIRGLRRGAVYNETGGQIILTFHSAKKSDGTCRALKDSGASANTLTVPNGETMELPSEIGAASFLAATLGSGTASNVWFHFEF